MAAMQEALELEGGIRRLGRMAGVESLARNLEAEDEAVRRNIDAYEAELFDGDLATGGESPEGEMRIMAARDVYVNQPQPTATQPVAPQAGVVGTEAVGSGDAKPAAPAAPLWKTLAKTAAVMAGVEEVTRKNADVRCLKEEISRQARRARVSDLVHRQVQSATKGR